MVQTGNLNLPESAGNASGSGDIVYAVKVQPSANHLEIRQFGVESQGGKDVLLKHGLFYTMHLNIGNTVMEAELARILQRHGFDSESAFRQIYTHKQTITPESPYAALPYHLGRDLFLLARKASNWDMLFPMHSDTM